MRVKMSVLALLNYDSTLFNDLSVPTGVDKPSLIDMLVTETADLSVIYPDPDLFKRIIKAWSTRKLPVWEKLYQTTQFVYNPLENYDRTETRTANIVHSGTVENTGTQGTTAENNTTTANTGTVSNVGTDTGTVANSGNVHNIESDTGDITQAKTGYNSSSFQDTDKQTNNLTNESNRSDINTEVRNLEINNTRTDNTEQNVNQTNQETRVDNLTETRNLSDTHSEFLKVNGNIGIRSSQELIEQERNIDTFDIYSVIIDDFTDYFCIGIY